MIIYRAKGEGRKVKGNGTRMTQMTRIGADFFTMGDCPIAERLHYCSR
jgi:hypothetical protein